MDLEKDNRDAMRIRLHFTVDYIIERQKDTHTLIKVDGYIWAENKKQR